MVNKIVISETEGKAIHLERYTAEHTQRIFGILDQEIGENIGWGLKENVEELEEYLKKDDLTLWVIFLNNELVGCVFLYVTIIETNVWSRRIANLGYFIDKHFRGKGCASQVVPWVINYAFEVLDIKRLIAGCLENNAISKKIIEKNGFRFVGIERNYARPMSSKKYLNHYLYDLIPEDS